MPKMKIDYILKPQYAEPMDTIFNEGRITNNSADM